MNLSSDCALKIYTGSTGRHLPDIGKKKSSTQADRWLNALLAVFSGIGMTAAVWFIFTVLAGA